MASLRESPSKRRRGARAHKRTESALIQAAIRGDCVGVKAAVVRGANVDAKDVRLDKNFCQL